MQAITNISIPQPCHENWNDMTPADKSRYCHLCQKNVIDFTLMSNHEIIDYLAGNHNVCGRFDTAQMGTINRTMALSSKTWFSWKRLALTAAITSLFVTNEAAAQHAKPSTHQSPIKGNRAKLMGDTIAYKLIKGKVIDGTDNTSLPGVLISVKGTNLCTNTNPDGEFKLNVPLSADSLTVSMVGYEKYETKIADLTDQSNCISLKMRSVILGGAVTVVCVEKMPFHKRLWYKVKHLF
ncbi:MULTISPECIES: carboxypeptidase-like regulatory domain-containing protein [unclassified Mucilaginibacter]|uniref:carboxypeptidase-like regulatory domain-containing protein n=1 Tax=unclassified Mucilaginibacter TaxID=2617802 RepID=UPI00095E635F|nr:MULTISPECIES: carboxypeptidase-like regulatory domain-containing protein [unclassified Mucilaginibacter]OJW14771.1 MAG: hypothetical protein BGO48_11350 [Mucilaginibacter sp. 44-25]PLW90093.1 MAG: hypothetical protein C0154_08160 [Mucilaginibacter sp.]HEK21986.1 carboxypeptidase-like regulatory domain-containing protein [Bacteroidota bacterium]